MPYIPRFSRAFSFGVYGGLRNADVVSCWSDIGKSATNQTGAVSAGYLACLAELGGDANKLLLYSEYNINRNIGTGTTAHVVRGWDGSASAANPAAGRATYSGGVAWGNPASQTDGVDDFVTIPQTGCAKASQTLIIRAYPTVAYTAAANSTLIEQQKTGVESGVDSNTWRISCYSSSGKVGFLCGGEGNDAELALGGGVGAVYALVLTSSLATLYNVTLGTSITKALTPTVTRTCDNLRVACATLADGTNYGFSGTRFTHVIDMNAALTIDQISNIASAIAFT